MEKMLQRILVTFTVGFLVIGAILGFVGVADCGSVFAPGDGCASTLSVQRALVIAFIGLGLTSLAASIVADKPITPTDSSTPADSSQHSEPGPPTE